MSARFLGALLGTSSGDFARLARSRGLSSRLALALEPAALELAPGNPQEILSSREAFERAAMRTVIGDAGNLELSFGLVDLLASAVETLGLTRESDIPDPFRRVWIRNSKGARKRGVVLRCDAGEVAVFCPPSQDDFCGAGNLLTMSYRGFVSSVEYDLQINDAVRLPDAFVLHLRRPDGDGAIGRDNVRVSVSLQATLRLIANDPSAERSEPIECRVLDVSLGGLRIASELASASGQLLEIEVALPDGQAEPIRLSAVVRWNRKDDEGRRTQGIQIGESSESDVGRYERFLEILHEAGAGADDTAVTEQPEQAAWDEQHGELSLTEARAERMSPPEDEPREPYEEPEPVAESAPDGPQLDRLARENRDFRNRNAELESESQTLQGHLSDLQRRLEQLLSERNEPKP